MYDRSCQHALFTYKFTGKERDSESGLDNFVTCPLAPPTESYDARMA